MPADPSPLIAYLRDEISILLTRLAQGDMPPEENRPVDVVAVSLA
ncbi:MAG: hypothetical protein ACE5LU_05505 [Anaerolineae bacterium]